jgi:hypothetical protein
MCPFRRPVLRLGGRLLATTGHAAPAGTLGAATRTSSSSRRDPHLAGATGRSVRDLGTGCGLQPTFGINRNHTCPNRLGGYDIGQMAQVRRAASSGFGRTGGMRCRIRVAGRHRAAESGSFSASVGSVRSLRRPSGSRVDPSTDSPLASAGQRQSGRLS